MPILNILRAHQQSSEKAEEAAKKNILIHIQNKINQAEYHYDDKGIKIFSEKAKLNLISQFKEEYEAILKVQNAGDLSQLGDIAEFFKINYIIAIDQYKIDARILKKGEDAKSEVALTPLSPNKVALPPIAFALTQEEERYLNIEDVIQSYYDPQDWHYKYNCAEKIEYLSWGTYLGNILKVNASIGLALHIDVPAACLVAYLHKRPNITALDLTNCQIGDDYAEILAHLSTIKKIKLSMNSIGAKGAIHLAKNDSFEEVKLDCNAISSSGVVAFAHNKKIKVLDIAANGAGIGSIKTLLHSNKTIKDLNISANKLLYGDVISAMAENKTIETLSLKYNNCFVMSDPNLGGNKTLKKIIFSKNFSFPGMLKLARGRHGLNIIDLTDDDINKDVASIIESTFKKNIQSRKALHLLILTLLPPVLGEIVLGYADDDCAFQGRGEKTTLLHEAVRNKSLLESRFLLEDKASLNASDEKGQTPLSLAAHNYLDNRDITMLSVMLEYDNGELFNKFKTFYQASPSYNFFSNTMSNLLYNNKIKNMKEVVSYLESKEKNGENNTKSHQAFGRLMRELASNPNAAAKNILT